MTRINCIPVRELSDVHLGAEYRELPRIFALVAAAAARGEEPSDRRNPTEYALGPGHVRFFYPRLSWVARRFGQIVRECKRRGRKTTYETLPAISLDIPDPWWGDWHPTRTAMGLNRARIADRKLAAENRRRGAMFD